MSESSKRRRYVFDNREDNHSCSVAQHTSSPLEEVKYTARYFFRDRSRRCHDVQAFYDNGAALSALSFVSMIEEMKARSAAEVTSRTRLLEALECPVIMSWMACAMDRPAVHFSDSIGNENRHQLLIEARKSFYSGERVAALKPKRFRTTGCSMGNGARS